MPINMKTLSAALPALLLSACVTLSGNYEIKAFDANGKPALTQIRSVAQGSGIYTARNAMCRVLGKDATIRIYDTDSGQELSSESPYRCR